MKYKQKNKKGISEMVGYVLLIVIALSVSAGVYAFLRAYIPKAQPECSEDVSLIIQDVSCTGGKIEITLNNKGLFNVDGFYIYADKTNLINKEDFDTSGTKLLKNLQIPPSKSVFLTYPSTLSTGVNHELILKPFKISSGKLLICTKAIVTQTVKCA